MSQPKTKESEFVVSLDDLQKQLGKETKQPSNLYPILKELLSKKVIEVKTRITDTELDKICLALHFGIKISIAINIYKFKEKNKENKEITFKDLEDEDIDISNLQHYVLLNLSLRLSLDGQSRKEVENVMISIIKTELDQLKKTMEKTEDSKEK